MSEEAAHLVDRVLPRAPYRQWVFTLPWELARAVAFDAELCRRVFALLAEEISRWQCTRARSIGISTPNAGSILEIQRFADGARLWPHGHLLAPDGVFYECADGRVRFRGIGPPKDEDVEAILTRVCERLRGLLRRRAEAAAEDEEAAEPQHQLLLQCALVAPSDRIVTQGSDKPGKSGTMARSARKPLCVRSPEGLELHADVHVKTSDRRALERVCRYMARPPISDDRLGRLPDGRFEFRLKRVWKGGVRSLVFEPFALIARLAALIPLPYKHMRTFNGVFAPAHRLRSRVVPRPPRPARTGRPVAPSRPARMGWADLLRRTFNIDGLRCPYCGGRLRAISAIHDPSVIQAIVAAVQLADGERAEAKRAEAAPRGPPVQVRSPAA